MYFSKCMIFFIIYVRYAVDMTKKVCFVIFICFCRIEIPFKFHMMHSGLVHGLAFWFDVAFVGSV